jgi:nanoRNase/pAp phosphatase (c-di-AMP/oligoRNAs hydrolase)
MRRDSLDDLRKAVAGAERILILPHNDPDPDAIAGAVALRHLLSEWLGVESRIAYKGIIGRAENRALVRILGRPLRQLTADDLRDPVSIGLVDTQPGAGNNPLTPGAEVAIVFDHHVWREATARAAFADVRPETGATSTILTEYLRAANIELSPTLATALFYGIKTDTMGLGRAASPADVTAYFHLQSRIDVDALAEIEHAQVSVDYFRSLDAVLHATRIYGDVVISYMGPLTHPDLAAEMADLLHRLQGAEWVICMGLHQGTLVLAVRTRNPRGGAGHLVQAIVGEMGTAGGHGTMAGGQVPLRGQDAGQLAEELAQRALRHLGLPDLSPGTLLPW